MVSPLRSWFLAGLLATAAAAQVADPPWRYTMTEPAEGWFTAAFDDASWELGPGGFGDPTTPGSRVGTEWFGDDIWLRRVVDLEAVPEQAALFLHHDEDAEVYLNGVLVATEKGYTTEYRLLPLSAAGREALRAGQNLVAVHCHQTTGGQFVDVHVVDGSSKPELPPAPRPERPFQTDLTTPWGAVVTADNAWREYPRPQLVRPQWTNLNGHWNYAVTSHEAPRPQTWDGQILVPFCLESALSGVQKLLHEDQALWYSRSLDEEPASGHRVLLHFEACDYETRVWVGDTEVGHHVGGNTPFSFDITEALTGAGDRLFVRVTDATGGYQLRGKQVRRPGAIWYTRVSGIWGTVWTEHVPERHVQRLRITTSLDGSVGIDVPGDVGAATAVARLDGREVARGEGEGGRIELEIADPELWAPGSPRLYDLEVTTGDDTVTSYFGIREVGRTRDDAGHWRLTLNGEPLFHWGTLDQGWWPDGLLTPPSDAAMRYDVDFLVGAGFNMVRKHIKVEPRRYYAYCDRVGIMVWQDHVSGGSGPRWTKLAPDPEDATWPDAAHAQSMAEFEAMIATLENHPSIVMWVPFNEAWGQHRTVEVGEWTVRRDPTRLVNVASGGNFWPVGHVCDAHSYPEPSFPFARGKGGRFDDYALVVGEFGGHGLAVQDHIWREAQRNWGYGGLPADVAEYETRYVRSLETLRALMDRGICAAVYTQTTDVESEINGLVTYDRKHVKLPIARLRELSLGLLR